MAELVCLRLLGDHSLLARLVGQLVPLADDDDGEVLAALVPTLQLPARRLDRDRLLGDQDRVRAAGNPAHDRDPTGMASHHLDDHHAVVGLGRRVQPIDRLRRDRDRGVEAVGVIRAGQIVFGTPTTGNECSAWSRAATPNVSSPPTATRASKLSAFTVSRTFWTPSSLLKGFVREVPRIVPPRGRSPEIAR